MIALLDLEQVQLDIKTTFPHGEEEEEIYMNQPYGYMAKVVRKENWVYKLRKLLYGLSNSKNIAHKK